MRKHGSDMFDSLFKAKTANFYRRTEAFFIKPVWQLEMDIFQMWLAFLLIIAYKMLSKTIHISLFIKKKVVSAFMIIGNE